MRNNTKIINWNKQFCCWHTFPYPLTIVDSFLPYQLHQDHLSAFSCYDLPLPLFSATRTMNSSNQLTIIILSTIHIWAICNNENMCSLHFYFVAVCKVFFVCLFDVNRILRVMDIPTSSSSGAFDSLAAVLNGLGVNDTWIHPDSLGAGTGLSNKSHFFLAGIENNVIINYEGINHLFNNCHLTSTTPPYQTFLNKCFEFKKRHFT